MQTETAQILERALLVGADTGEDDGFDDSMTELGSLAEACGMLPVGKITQKIDRINTALCVGPGKAAEIAEYGRTLEADLVIFDNALTPSQLRNLQRELKKPILDRTALILEIFSSRAKTREAKLQVETAKLQYLLPRLVGLHDALTRQGGGSGSLSNKGSGEKKLELDRRKIEHRITELKKELEEVQKERETQSKRRRGSKIPKVALVGYTNAGKSTLMNRMVEAYLQDDDKKVLEADMLFATLETTVRKIEAKGHQNFLLSDTVGFLHKLPHGLVQAFRSTLEEVKNADLLLLVADYSDVNCQRQIDVTKETLQEIGAAAVPIIYVYNKADLKMDASEFPRIQGNNRIYLSAKSGQGLAELVEMVVGRLYEGHRPAEFVIPYEKGGVASYFMENTYVQEQVYREDGIHIQTVCGANDRQKYAEYLR